MINSNFGIYFEFLDETFKLGKERNINIAFIIIVFRQKLLWSYVLKIRFEEENKIFPIQ